VPKTAPASAAQSDHCHKFDYCLLQPSVAKFLMGQAARIQGYSTKAIIQIGKDLARAKHYLSHGQFLRWVEDEVGLPARTAQAYMRVASWTSSKSATVALLPPTALYALSSPGLPAEFVESVVRKVEAGERLELPPLRAQIRALRENSAAHGYGTPAGGSDEQPDDPQATPSATPTTAMISSAVRILARALTEADFATVRQIITSKPVLNDPDLPSILAHAFESYEATTSDFTQARSSFRTSRHSSHSQPNGNALESKRRWSGVP
jgi:hypothetical protein